MAFTNDLEMFIELFKCVAAAWKWLEDKWAHQLLLLLLGKAQFATKYAAGLSEHKEGVLTAHWLDTS